MRIEILEETGIKCQEYGHLKHGDTVTVDDNFGAFACANGWAKDVSGHIQTGKRGSLDRQNPEAWAAKQARN